MRRLVGLLGWLILASCFVPPLLEAEEPCAEPTQEQALWQLCLDQRNAMLGPLKEKWDKFQALWSGAEDYVEAYRAAIATCAIVDIISEVLGAALTNAAVKRVEGIIRASLEPEWDIEGALDALSQGTPVFGVGTIDGMRDKVFECYGNGGIPKSLYDGAMDYIKNLEEALAMMPEIRKLLNDIRQKDLECQDKEIKYRQACFEYAECAGKDSAPCYPRCSEGQGFNRKTNRCEAYDPCSSDIVCPPGQWCGAGVCR